MPSVKSANALATGTSTQIDFVIAGTLVVGSGMSGLLLACFGLVFQLYQCGVPHIVDVRSEGLEPGALNVIDASGAERPVSNETGVFEDLEVLRDCRSADRQAGSELADGLRAGS